MGGSHGEDSPSMCSLTCFACNAVSVRESQNFEKMGAAKKGRGEKRIARTTDQKSTEDRSH